VGAPPDGEGLTTWLDEPLPIVVAPAPTTECPAPVEVTPEEVVELDDDDEVDSLDELPWQGSELVDVASDVPPTPDLPGFRFGALPRVY